MKKIIPLILLLLITTLAFAQNTFSSYGFQNQVIQGLEGQYIYYIRSLPSQQIPGSAVILNFEAPKALNTQKSFIHVLVNDIPVYSGHFQTDSINKLLIRINQAEVQKGDFLKLTVKSQLFIGNDVCQDENNPALWLRILPQSSIIWNTNKKYSLTSINLSNALFSKKAIVYPNNISAGELRAVALAFTRLKKYGIDEISLYPMSQLPDSLKDFIVIGLRHKIPLSLSKLIKRETERGEGLLYLYKDRASEKTFDFKQILFLTANDIPGLSKALDALLTPGLITASFQDHLLIKKTGYKNLIKGNRIYLSDLEEGNNIMNGNGTLSHNYSFKTTAFSEIPANLNLQFEVKYTGISRNDRGYFNVYLNGILLNSRQLNEAGSLLVSTAANRYQLKKFNTLKTEFVFYPANGVCSGNFRRFIGQIVASNSYLEVTDAMKEKQPSFYSYPDVFQKNTAILVSKAALSYSVKAIADLVNQLNDHYSNEVVYRPIIDFSNNAAKYKSDNLILITGRKDSLLNGFSNMPLQYKSNFTIYDGNRNEPIYKLSAPDASIITQVFSDENYPSVLSIALPDENSSSAALEKTIFDMGEQFSVFAGNTLINNTAEHLMFDLERNSNNIVYDRYGNSKWLAIWARYKLLVLAGALVLIFLAYLYVRSKVKQSQTIVK